MHLMPTSDTYLLLIGVCERVVTLKASRHQEHDQLVAKNVKEVQNQMEYLIKYGHSVAE